MPDYSAYADMNLWRQMENIAHSRWVGAFWQSRGIKVIPTVSWSDARSYSFCFDEIENRQKGRLMTPEEINKYKKYFKGISQRQIDEYLSLYYRRQKG